MCNLYYFFPLKCNIFLFLVSNFYLVWYIILYFAIIIYDKCVWRPLLKINHKYVWYDIKNLFKIEIIKLYEAILLFSIVFYVIFDIFIELEHLITFQCILGWLPLLYLWLLLFLICHISYMPTLLVTQHTIYSKSFIDLFIFLLFYIFYLIYPLCCVISMIHYSFDLLHY